MPALKNAQISSHKALTPIFGFSDARFAASVVRRLLIFCSDYKRSH
jgi:hypothetical protein